MASTTTAPPPTSGEGSAASKEQDLQQQSDVLKNEANKQFEAAKYQHAIDLYTRAIELTPNNAVLYSNRAFANIRTEAFGSALVDAQKAIDLDKKYIKGYYRMATAKLALGKHKEALNYFRQVVKLVPNDRDARKKLDECEKTVKARLFEAAISAEHKDVFASLKIDDIFIEQSYTGLHMPNPITLEFVKDLIAQFKDQKKLHKKYVAQLLVGIKNMLDETPTLVDITVDQGHHFTVCGDTHGQFYDLCNIFELGGLPSEVLVIHGGLFSNDNVTLDDIRKLDRNMEPPDSGIMAELLWSDPQPYPGRAPSKRGVGVAFGPDVTERFLQANGLSLIVRSHEVKDEGYALEQGGKVITIFSAPNYCDQVGNKGAYIRFEHDMEPKFTTFSSVPHPPMRPMFYANSMSTFGF